VPEATDRSDAAGLLRALHVSSRAQGSAYLGTDTATEGEEVTPEQQQLFESVEEVLASQHQAFDELCETYAAAFLMDAATADHPTVKSCLEDAALQLHAAGMNWYVSTK
jgi:hypothetical protein